MEQDFFLTILNANLKDMRNPLYLRKFCWDYLDAYLITDHHRSVIRSAVERFREYYSSDKFFINVCDDIIDAIEENIFRTTNSILFTENKFDLTHYDPEEFDTICVFEEQLLKDLIDHTNGQRLEMCRILKGSPMLIQKKIEQYGLRGLVNSTRRDYRGNLSTVYRDSYE